MRAQLTISPCPILPKSGFFDSSTSASNPVKKSHMGIHMGIFHTFPCGDYYICPAESPHGKSHPIPHVIKWGLTIIPTYSHMETCKSVPSSPHITVWKHVRLSHLPHLLPYGNVVLVPYCSRNYIPIPIWNHIVLSQ